MTDIPVLHTDGSLRPRDQTPPDPPEPYPGLQPDDWANRWLWAYTTPIGYANLTKSARHAGIKADHVRTRLQNDTVFQHLKQRAEDDIRDLVDSELLRRATTPILRPVVSMGEIIAVVEDWDNRLLLQVAERLNPEKWHLPLKIQLAAPGQPSTFTFRMGEEQTSYIEATAHELPESTNGDS